MILRPEDKKLLLLDQKGSLPSKVSLSLLTGFSIRRDTEIRLLERSTERECQVYLLVTPTTKDFPKRNKKKLRILSNYTVLTYPVIIRY